MDQANYSDLEVAPIASDLEVAPTPQKEVVALQENDLYGQHSGTNGANTIWGLRRRTFWLIVVAILIIVGVAGGVGAHYVGKKRSFTISPSVNGTTSSSTKVPGPSPTSSPGPLPPAMNNTGLALASWRSSTNDTEFNARLFYQGNSGELRERTWISGSGWSSNSTPILDIIARNNTPLSQVSVSTKSGIREIQLFYLNSGNTICDVIYSGSKWVKGKLESQNITTGADSKLGAMPWRSGSEVVLYYQDSYSAVHELRWKNNSWSSSSLPGFLTAKGSGIGVLYSVDNGDEQVRIYTQTPDHAIVSKDFIQGQWYLPYSLYNSTATPLGTSVAATILNTWSEYQGLMMVRVYFVGEGDIVKVLTWENDWSWDPKNLTECVGGGAIAAMDWDKKSGRAYFEMREGALGEIITEDGANWNASNFRI